MELDALHACEGRWFSAEDISPPPQRSGAEYHITDVWMWSGSPGEEAIPGEYLDPFDDEGNPNLIGFQDLDGRAIEPVLWCLRKPDDLCPPICFDNRPHDWKAEPYFDAAGRKMGTTRICARCRAIGD